MNFGSRPGGNVATRRPVWRPLDTTAGGTLHEARLQLHHAAQLVSAIGISYLPRQHDDSHTNFDWNDEHAALVGRPIVSRTPFRVGVQPQTLALLVLETSGRLISSYPLHGRTIADASGWLTGAIARLGAEPERYTLRKHFEIPPHRVVTGARFDASDAPAYGQLAAWYGDAASLLEELRGTIDGAGPVRCWPHHFDIATLITMPTGETVGAGMEPGDKYYDEPYFYVSVNPAPPASALSAPLEGRGFWHTHEWSGAALPCSLITNDRAAQQQQARAFLESAVAACREL